MCGRYDLTTTRELPDRFAVHQALFDFAEPRYNVAPTQTMPVVTADRQLVPMSWGFIPVYAKKPEGFINARAETVATSPAFKKAFATRRCLVPATGFYEWQKTPQGKVPHRISCTDQDLFAFAGIHTTWTDPNGHARQTYAILTTQPNALMAPIHNRMPVILRRDAEEDWLSNGEHAVEQLLSLLAPYPAQVMRLYPVSRAVNSPANDSPAVLVPV
ncbi:MAG TPA: SOS response-associated peptidase [Ktedonobacterales bacterium]|nr:SOS response-associated peptidase [Ktedonobacterales bacterium]